MERLIIFREIRRLEKRGNSSYVEIVFLEIGRLEKGLIFLCGDGLYSWRFEDWRKDESSYVKMDYIPGDWKIGEGMLLETWRLE